MVALVASVIRKIDAKADRRDKPTQKALPNFNSVKKLIEVNGQSLRAQYRIGKKYLVLATEGISSKEVLYVYLYNDRFKLVDALELSDPLTESRLRDVRVSRGGELRFAFFSAGEEWVLEVFKDPKYTIYNCSYPAKRNAAHFDQSWLSLQKSSLKA